MEQLKKIYPKKLLPPPEAIKREREKSMRQIPKNKILKFFYIFFGEGF